MKVLVVGNGARENALVWKFSKSNRITGLYAAPGNAGCEDFAELIPLDPLDSRQVVEACRAKGVELVFIGPEAPLEAGLADDLTAAGIPAIGPGKKSAQLESSKVFSKDFMVRNGVPTAQAREFSDYSSFEAFIRSTSSKVVVKKSGLAAGKGVLETEDKEEALAFGKEILTSDKLLVEEFLTGFEISVFVLSDGKDWIVLPPCADFKKAGENDTGPNTGGMGAICPVPSVNDQLWNRVIQETVKPTMDGLNKDGLNYKGVIFIGLMITEQGPKVLEYNVRFGDPETQVLLPRLDVDFLDLCEALWKGTLAQTPVDIFDHAALGVVVAAPGYPGAYPKGLLVSDQPAHREKAFYLFHAATHVKDGDVLTDGGRCFTCVGLGETFLQAQNRAYRGAAELAFPGAWYRKDIGEKYLIKG